MTQLAHSVPAADAKQRVFEIRTYTTEPGKLPDLLKRFREHTTKLFEKHGMTNIGYWVPTDEPRSKDTLIYILAHDSRDAAKKSWDGFQADPDWIKARDASEAAGKIVTQSRIRLRRPHRLLGDQVAAASVPHSLRSKTRHREERPKVSGQRCGHPAPPTLPVQAA